MQTIKPSKDQNQRLVQKNQHEPESGVTKGGDTSTNIPGNSIGTEVISSGEGGSDDNINGPKVLLLNINPTCV